MYIPKLISTPLKIVQQRVLSSPGALLACTFVGGFPEQVKRLLRASTRMNALAIDQLLSRARAIMKHCLAVAAARTIQSGTKKLPTGCPRDTITCRRANHLVKDCVRPQVERWKKTNTMLHVRRDRPHMNEALPAITVRINGVKGAALVGTSYSQLLASRMLCHF